MKKVFLLFALFAVCNFGLISCTDDDDINSENGTEQAIGKEEIEEGDI